MGLVAEMRLGHLKVKASAIFLLSQIALGGPHTAARIALLDGLTKACAASCSAEGDAVLTMNTALLINNLAALGGEEAVQVNHLSRSEDSAKCLHAVGVVAALRRVTERPHALGSVEAQQAYAALALMAMANIAVRQEHHAPVVSAQDKPALKLVVHFLRYACVK